MDGTEQAHNENETNVAIPAATALLATLLYMLSTPRASVTIPMPYPADLVFDPTLAHRGFCRAHRGVPTGGPLAREAPCPMCRRAVRLTSRTSHARAHAHARAYVDPFDLVCHGLGSHEGARNHRPG